jgi:hypothetical protein
MEPILTVWLRHHLVEDLIPLVRGVPGLRPALFCVTGQRVTALPVSD